MPLSLIIAILRETFGLDVDSVGITLRQLLTAEELLFVGSVETSLLNQHAFSSLKLAMTFAFRKSESNASPPLSKRKEPKIWPPARADHSEAYRKSHFTVPQKTAPPTLKQARKPMPDLTFAEQLADKGELREAAEICEVSLFHHRPSARVFHLLGLLHDCAGDQFNAGEFYRKALYLDPDHYEALIHLALLEDKSGRFAVAKLLKTRARRRGAQAPGRRRLRRHSTTGLFLWHRGQRREIIEVSSRSQSNR
jgi:chemotaxis protein methyltransferase WspC